MALEVTSTGTSSPTRPRHASAAASACLGCDEVGLGEREDARERGEPRVVLGQLALDHGEVGLGLAAVERREIEDVHEQPGALDMGEEVVAEPGAVAGALDQAGDVGDHELAVVGLERAEHGLERRERVGGDLRLRPRHPREQRGLARVGQADEPDVGEQLEVEPQRALVSGQPALGEPRRLPRRTT